MKKKHSKSRPQLSDSDPDLSLSCKISTILDEYMCPICMAPVRNCHMTLPCCHLFCHDCIDECMNRKPVCPSCISEVSSVVPNCHADRMVNEVIRQAKEDASARFFEGLVVSAGDRVVRGSKGSGSTTDSENFEAASPGGELKNVSRFEAELHQRVGVALKAYKDYFELVHQHADQRKQRIRSEFAKQLAATTPAEQSGARRAETMENLNQQCKEAVRAIDDATCACMDALLASYTSHLDQVAPTPTFLPLTVDLEVAPLQRTLKRLTIKRTDTLADVVDSMRSMLADQDDPVETVSLADLQLVVRVEGNGVFDFADNGDGSSKAALPHEDYVLDPKLPVCMQCEPVRSRGATLILRGPDGSIKLESAKAPECFANVFRKGVAGQTQNYFACGKCALNWICEGCANACHKDHPLLPCAKNHTPSYACCYCKKKCKGHRL